MKLSVSIQALLVATALLVGCNEDKKDEAAPAASAKPTAAAKADTKAKGEEAEGENEPAKAAVGAVKAADLKAEHNKHIVDNLNEICPDTHCEGEFNWDFKTFECKAGKCTLGFDATSHTTKKKLSDKLTFDYAGEVLDGEGTETDAFNDALTKAILDWEMKHR
ncbi:MAG: hypothetical protein R3B72_08290 [Polyangiaceae bacterium]